MRFLFGVWVCKVLVFLGKVGGKKGSSTPGRIALKICPDMLRILSGRVKKQTVCVLGTNGKTTTNNMINTLIKNSGFETVCNAVGANMLDGVATAFAVSAGFFGNLSADYAVIEIDEASAKIVFKHITPDVIVITNLFRDQLDRYGEIDITIEHIKKAVFMAEKATLVINADDPLCNYFSTFADFAVITYGITQKVSEPAEEAREGRFCLCCGNELKYNYYHYSQLGDYECEKCGFKRGTPDFSAENIVSDPKISFSVNSEIQINSDIYGFYNIYNMLAALSAASCLNDIKIEDYQAAFSGYKPQTGRMEEFLFKEKPVILNLAKNPAGFNQAIMTVLSDKRKKSVVIAINDNAQDGHDVSWIYDVDFELLKDNCEQFACSGKRAYDMALRLYYAEADENPTVNPDPVAAAMSFLENDSEVIYILVNYTLIFEAQAKLVDEMRKRAGV